LLASHVELLRLRPASSSRAGRPPPPVRGAPEAGRPPPPGPRAPAAGSGGGADGGEKGGEVAMGKREGQRRGGEKGIHLDRGDSSGLGERRGRVGGLVVGGLNLIG